MRKDSKKNKLIWFFKITLTILLVAILFYSGYLDSESLYLSYTSPSRFIPALFLLFFGIFASGIRWWILLKVSGLNVGFKSAMCIQLIGSFFSAYLPGAAGGDVVRGTYVLRHIKKDKGRSAAFFSIVADRVLALFGLLSIAGLMSFYIMLTPENGIDAVSYIELVVRIIAWAGSLFLLALLLTMLLRLFRVLSYFPPRLQAYAHVMQMTVKMYWQKWPMLLLCGIISMTASAVVAIGIVIIASIFPFAPEHTISAIAGVFGNVFSAIPLTPGGLGVGEVVFAKICTDLTKFVSPYGTIYLTFRVGMLLANIPGAILSLLWKGKLLTSNDNFIIPATNIH